MLRSVTTKFRRAVVRATPPIRRSAVLHNAGPSCNAVYCGGNGSRVTQVAREGQFIIQQDQAAALSLKELLSQKDGAAAPYCEVYAGVLRNVAPVGISYVIEDDETRSSAKSDSLVDLERDKKWKTREILVLHHKYT